MGTEETRISVTTEPTIILELAGPPFQGKKNSKDTDTLISGLTTRCSRIVQSTANTLIHLNRST